MPQINAAGLALIKEYEGCSLSAYPDPGTGGAPWTIGYGHTSGVHAGQTITQQKADDFLASDLGVFERGVNNLVSRNLTPNQFAALVSFAYNVGLAALGGSTLLAMVNAGEFTEAQQQFSRWIHGGDGEVLDGLVLRRAAEAQLFGKE